MTTTTIGRPKAVRNLTGILLLVLLFIAVCVRMDAAEVPGGAPQIMAARIGLAEHYKVGYWTQVRVDVDRFQPDSDARIEVTVEDSDGLATVVSAPLRPASTPDLHATALVYTKIGRAGSPLTIALIDGERRIDELTVQPDALDADGDMVELASTAELVAILSADAQDMVGLDAAPDALGGHAVRRIAQIDRVSDLPDRWFGYEAADLLVIAANDAKLLRDLAADQAHFAALVRWVELGGRLVILCGGENAEQLLAAGGPLAPLLPARLAEVVRLPETGPLEHFAKSEATIAGRGRTAIRVPRLVDVEGKIEVYAGREPTELPLVVRSPRGFGEIAFAGVDLTRPPLADWPGRAAFLQALLRPYLGENDAAAAPQSLVARGYNDLSGALRQRLGRSFNGVAPITFPIVTVLAIAYLLVLGPLDYLVVHRWLSRPWVAWITFPLTVILFGGAALALAEWRMGAGGERVNRIELVDIDTTTGQARGTFWATLYSPRARQFDLAVDVEPVFDDSHGSVEVLLSSLGLPGEGIGGMQARRTDLGIGEGEYQIASDLAALKNVPVITSATKSLLARWTMPSLSPVQAELADQDTLATGYIENRSGRQLRNVRLFYNGWAYRLGHLLPGRRAEVGENSSPRRLKTVVTQDALGADAPALAEGIVFDPERATANQLLKLMMFYEAAGGLGFAGLPSQYQAYCDLSRMLEVGRAVLVADVETPGSRLVDSVTGRPLGDKRDAAEVVYRVVLPVKSETEN